MHKPLIGITTPTLNVSLNMSSSQSVTLIANTYLEIINDYDCIPILLPSLLSIEQINSLSSLLHGLLLTSGQDLAPSNYGAEGKVRYSHETRGIGNLFERPMNISPNLKRDETEILFYHLAKKRCIPILGICRGMQLINVAEGGSLHQELPESSVSHYLDPDGWINYHDINVLQDTLCAKLLGVHNAVVSSIHHQAIDEMGSQLRISGCASDGIIELIEHENPEQFIIGVQAHIEKTRKNQPIFENIFKAFFERAREYKLNNRA